MSTSSKLGIETLSWCAGLYLLAIYGGAQAWSSYASDHGLDVMREARAAHTGESMQAHELQPSTMSATFPRAVIRIPSLGLEVPVYAGTAAGVLNRGAGLIEGTAWPGSDHGNIGIAAHRDSFFRSLEGIRPGAQLYIDTVQSTRGYRVTSTSVVEPQDVAVLADTGRPSVTLVTCYPFHYVGAAPQRFIVRAELSH
jgi:LPXTG-site transpeptidase (sortase) family protein